jgi:CDP-paratose 2-epimerase
MRRSYRHHARAGSDLPTRPAEIPYYVSNADRVQQATGWSPARSVATILDEILEWLARYHAELEPVLG